MSVISKLTTIGAAGGQSGPDYWASRIEKTANDEITFSGVCCDSSDNIIAVGKRDYYSSKGFVIKYDKFGNVKWQREFDVGGSDVAFFGKVAADSNDNIYITAGSNVSSVLTNHIVKYNSSGVLQWVRSYAKNVLYTFRDIGVDDSDYIYVTGNEASSRCLWAKYDASGTLLNSKNLYNGTPYSESFGAGAVVPSTGEWIQAGHTSQNGVDTDGTLLKMTSNGAISFRKRYFGSNTQRVYSAGAKADGSAFYCFLYDFNGGSTNGLRILKTNSSGSITRSVYLNGQSFTGDMTVDSNTRVLIRSGSGFISCDEFLNAGSTFSRLFTSFFPLAMTVDSEDNIIIAGKTGSSTFRSDEGAVVKLPSDGTGLGTWDWFTYYAGTATISGTIGVSNTNQSATLQTVTGTFGSVDPFTKTDPGYTTEIDEITP